MSTTLVVSTMMTMILPMQHIAYAQSNNTRVALTSAPTPPSAATTASSGNNTSAFNLEVNGKSYPIFLTCFIYCWSL